jgi:hypothetical protein
MKFPMAYYKLIYYVVFSLVIGPTKITFNFLKLLFYQWQSARRPTFIEWV